MSFIVEENIEKYAHRMSRTENALLRELELYTKENVDYPQMLTGRLEGGLLRMLVAISGAKSILEVGTFTGYSALSMAEALPNDGRITTCEISEKNAEIAQSFFDRSENGSKIELKIGAAADTIKALTNDIDLAFIDADKASYPEYYELILPKLKSGGLIVFDNMLWSGKVLNPKDEDTKALASLNSNLAEDTRVDNVLLTVRDGVQLVRKL